MNQITREQAFDLAKYRYKLMDKSGNKYSIVSVTDFEIRIKKYGEQFAYWKKIGLIGTNFFILCRDLSQLTETIEHEGESFVPLERLLWEDNFNLDVMSKTEILEFKEVYGDEDFMSYKTSGLLQSWHFNLGFPQETVKLL